ncbi:hypothetical protein B0H14DRAFT_3894796 [Mycena olivaceomarginata]|nr:hypothetical protein B0H14DRAFT_3894796 [Mycena olivaceomarginata]
MGVSLPFPMFFSALLLASSATTSAWALVAPPTGPSNIADTKTEEVAWCTLPRNNAQVIPDSVITGVDAGGELNPHGAEGTGNPVGGNVTTTVADGTDLAIAEWMLYMSADQFCLRACNNANATYSAAAMCGHKLDVMGPPALQAPETRRSHQSDPAQDPAQLWDHLS